MAKRALIVGCNYPGSAHELKGCRNDAQNMHSLLQDVFGYQPQNMVVMLDTDSNSMQPTGINIKVSCVNPDPGCQRAGKSCAHFRCSAALELLCHLQAQLSRLVSLTAAGDSLFFHYSGHGTQVPTDGDDHEADGLDEAIVPVDMNLIVDDDLRLIFCQLPVGARMTMLADCCHSGTMLDHSLVQLERGQQSVSRALTMPGCTSSLQSAGRDFRNRYAHLHRSSDLDHQQLIALALFDPCSYALLHRLQVLPDARQQACPSLAQNWRNWNQVRRFAVVR